MYNGFIEGAELTTKELNKFGFNSKDLTALIDQDVITRVKRGLYSLKSVDKLFFYGKELIAQKEYDKATQCFQKCYELDPTHKGVCFQLFLKSIQNKDYQKAFEYFDVFYISDNEFYNTDSAFYLFLLSTITKLPENHRNYAKFLKFDDFKIDARDKRYRFIARQNKMRLSASNQKFSLAIKQLNEILAQKGASTVQDLLIKKLLIQAAAVQKQNREYLINLIKQKKYEEIIKFYEDMESYHRLSTSDIYILILTKDLVNIISTKTIPPKEIFETNNIFDAITGKNFELALNLSNARNQEFKIDKDDNHISLLLEEIVNTCRELSTPIKQEPEIIPIVPKEEISLTTEQATFADVFLIIHLKH